MSTPIGPIVLELPAHLLSPVVLRAAIRSLAESFDFVHLGEPELEELCTAVQEACTNVIRHACSGDPSERFSVTLHARDDRLAIEIADSGPPFDVCAAPPADLDTLSEGGFGIHIMRSWTDQLTSERRGDRNVLTLMRLYRTAVGAGGGDAVDG